MLVISLGLPLLLLAAVNLIALRSRKPGAKIVCLCLVALLGGPFLGFVFPSIALLALLLLAALGIWHASGRGPAFFRSLSLAAGVIALGIPGLLACQDLPVYARLRARYAYESMEGRLPTPKPSPRTSPPNPEALTRLSRLEEDIRESGIRVHRLKMLHDDAVGLFVACFGFGVARLSPYPSEANLAYGLREGPGLLQPGRRIAPARSPGEWGPSPDGAEEPLGRLHDEGVIEFAHPAGFGYVKDRRHVAGFEGHRFGEVPGSWGRWELQTLELVGLLVADEPRIYVSDHLPRMDGQRDVPTRPLDPFEAVGLETIRGGDDLLIARDGATTRMLGAIRSLKQCVACHGGERGDLLGAFSYTLRRSSN